MTDVLLEGSTSLKAEGLEIGSHMDYESGCSSPGAAHGGGPTVTMQSAEELLDNVEQ